MSDPKHNKPVDDVTGTETTGHSWDGIEEYNNPLPRWWLWTFYLCIIWGIGYTIAYPAWPMINSATAGVMGWSTRANVANDIAAVEEANAPINAKLESVELTAIASDADLNSYAVSAGSPYSGFTCHTTSNIPGCQRIFFRILQRAKSC